MLISLKVLKTLALVLVAACACAPEKPARVDFTDSEIHIQEARGDLALTYNATSGDLATAPTAISGTSTRVVWDNAKTADDFRIDTLGDSTITATFTVEEDMQWTYHFGGGALSGGWNVTQDPSDTTVWNLEFAPGCRINKSAACQTATIRCKKPR